MIRFVASSVARVAASAVAIACLTASCSPATREAEGDTAAVSTTPSTPSTPGTPAASASTDTGAWRPLFDGRTLAGWRGYKSQTVPTGWRVVDSTLVRDGEGGDLVSADKFRNFELALEWKVKAGGNSGIMYRVTEENERTYQSGIEMQVLDDAKHVDGKSALTSAGALYGLYPAPKGAVKPAGEWNEARIVANGAHIEHWLNGVKMAEAELESDDWKRRIADSKFKEWPGFAKAAEGHIALQDHGDWVAYRNIRIRTLP